MVYAADGSASASVIPASSFLQIQTTADDLPIKTAVRELQQFLKARTGKEILISTSPDEAAAGEMPKPGNILLSIKADTTASSPSEDDDYEILERDGAIIVNGSNARAVLYGVYELEDVMAEQGGVPQGFSSRAAPSMKLRLLHPRVRGGFGSYRRSDFEFMARCGGNVAHLTHDWHVEKTLFSFVPSEVFPQAVNTEKLEKNRAQLRQYLDWCKPYGLDGAMWLCEIPCQGGPWLTDEVREAFLKRFPADCLSDTGTYQGKVLCLAHPKVEQEYRRLVRQFLTDFPGISMFLVFTMDSSGELCDPATCPRHKGVSKLTQYNRLISLMVEEGRKMRADFQVFSVAWGWKFRGDPNYLPEQAKLPVGIGFTMTPDGEAWSFDRKKTDFLISSKTLAQRQGQKFLGYDIFFWGDDTVFNEMKGSYLPQGLGVTALYDFPLGVAAKLRRWNDLGADGYFDQWGTMAEYIQANAIALRELTFHPEHLAPEKIEGWAKGLAAKRLGAKAASGILAAWMEIESAQQIQSDNTLYWHGLRPAWSGPSLKCPLTLEALNAVKPANPEPSKPYGFRDYAPFKDDVARCEALAPALRQAADHFAKALKHLETAQALIQHGVQEATNTGAEYDHWYAPELMAGSKAPARFSPLELINEQIIAVRLQERTQRRMSRFFEAYALAQKLPAPGTPAYAEKVKILDRLRAEDEVGKGRE